MEVPLEAPPVKPPEVIVAMAGEPLVHDPPPLASVRLMEFPIHMDDGPAIAAIGALTVTEAVT